MGTGYTRNDTGNNIADGNVINASDLDGEFDAIQAAFNESTGHTHDGTSAEGAPITKLGPSQNVEVGTGAITPSLDNTVDLGSGSLEFKDLYIDGTANIDSLVADTADINAGTIDGTTIGGSTPAAATVTTLTVNGNTTLGDAATDTVTFTADVASNVIPSADDTYDLGASGSEWKDLYIDGTANIDSLVADTADINAGTIDGVTIGGAAAGVGTFTTANATTVDTTNIEVTNIKAKDGSAAATIADSTGVITVGSSVLTTTDINGGTIDGTTIGGASAAAGTFTTATATTGNITTVNATTVDTTNLEVTNIKAKDGTAAASIADSTGVFSHATTTVFPAGAVGTPSITTTGDTNTGIFFPAADTIAFAEGGAEAMRIDSSGRVGIGTTSPVAELHIADTAANAVLRLESSSSGAGTIFFDDQDATNIGIVSYDHSDNSLRLGTSASERIRIDSSGNVGIGTSSPANTLDVNGAIANSTTNSASGVIFTKDRAITSISGNTGPSAFPHALALSNPDTTTDTNLASLGFNVSTSGAASNAVIAGQSLSAGNMALTFYTESSNVIGERMRITDAGEVLVGGATEISSASGALTLERTAGGILNFFRNNASVSGSTIGVINFLGDDTTSSTPTVHAYVKAEASGGHNPGDNPTDLVFGTTPDGSETVTEAMRITYAGNVGIGTSTPAQPLTVALNGAGIQEILRLQNVNAASGHRLVIGVDDDNNKVYYTSTGASAGSHVFRTGLTEVLEIRVDGTLDSQDTYDNTQSGSTVVVTSGGLIGRTSSSIKYKKDIEDLDAALVSNAVANLRPVWYRTKNAKGDDKETWSHIGLIAEEVHEVEPRLVRYRTEKVEFVDVEEEVTKTREVSPAVTDEEGNVVQEAVTEEYTETVTRKEKQKTPLETPEPEDVDYGRLAVLCLAKIQEQDKTIAALEARIAALESNTGE